jgi:hypothetical protein
LGEGSGTDQGDWHSVLVGPAPLTNVVIVGSGKDADILIAFVDGRELSMGAGMKFDSRDPEGRDAFHEALRAWLASDSSCEFNFYVDADIVLAADGR